MAQADTHIQTEQAPQYSLKGFHLTLWNTPSFLLLLVIRFYQRFISPALPANTCRFYPTCSQYGFAAIYKYGVIKGTWIAVRRIVRCNPFNPGGYDPVP